MWNDNDHTALLSIRVIGDAPPTLNDLRNDLIRATEFRLVEAPERGSLVQVEIEWADVAARSSEIVLATHSGKW